LSQFLLPAFPFFYNSSRLWVPEFSAHYSLTLWEGSVFPPLYFDLCNRPAEPVVRIVLMFSPLSNPIAVPGLIRAMFLFFPSDIGVFLDL